MADALGSAALPHHLATSHMVKLWSGNKQLHYECGIYAHRKVIELGLHFEADPMTNARLLGAFRGHEKALARRLATARIEAWDKGWSRVWEPIPLQPLDERFSAQLVTKLARYIRVLEPILEAELPADVRWTR
ncbi:MAG TPA: hypothetical protein VIL53_07000 [Solirubrobacterales bacterium]